ncbi:Kelch repeat-containing protein [Brevundimonas sp. NPDC092305]|uniref:Kelch repeat-containing protein n=1 Tax=Brevundimonas sp. NPDC092305 TaxID=3363957 RepID=UPI0038053329
MPPIDRRSFLVASAAVAVSPAPARAREAGWVSKANMPWAVQEIYAAVHDGKIVTAGGLAMRRDAPLHVEDRVGMYDPVADRWEEGPRLPAPRHHPMLISGDADLYAIGGYAVSPAGEWTNQTTGWVLAEGSWKPIAPLPSPQAEAVGVGWGETLHLVTGRTPAGEANGNWNDQADSDRHLIYHVGDDRWSVGRPCPMARNSAAAAAMDGAIWVAGGRTVSGGGTGRLDRYTLSEDRWDTLAPVPRSYAANNQVGGGLAMAALNGRLVAFGGEWFRPRAQGGGGGVFAETWLYDPKRDLWEAGPEMKTPRHGLAAAAMQDAVYAIAGGAVVSGGRATGTVESFRF